MRDGITPSSECSLRKMKSFPRLRGSAEAWPNSWADRRMNRGRQLLGSGHEVLTPKTSGGAVQIEDRESVFISTCIIGVAHHVRQALRGFDVLNEICGVFRLEHGTVRNGATAMAEVCLVSRSSSAMVCEGGQ